MFQTNMFLGDMELLVEYDYIPGRAPSARTMANPMGVDDGDPPEINIISVIDTENGDELILGDSDYEKVQFHILDNHQE